VFKRAPRPGLAGIAILGVLALAAGVTLLDRHTPAPSQRRSVGSPAPVHGAFAPEDLRVLHDAEELLIRKCMQEQGFDYWPVPAAPITAAERFPYVIDNAKWANENGFGPSDDAVPDDRNTSPTGRYLGTLTPAVREDFTAALDGTQGGPAVTVHPPGGTGVIGHSASGCTAHAEGALYGNFPSWFEASTTAGFLHSIVHGQVIKDPRYLAAQREWSTCMQNHGYHYPTPGDAGSAYLASGRIHPDHTEVAVAVTESGCANRTSLAGTADELDTKYSADLSPPDQTLQVRYRNLIQEALPRATAIIDAG